MRDYDDSRFGFSTPVWSVVITETFDIAMYVPAEIEPTARLAKLLHSTETGSVKDSYSKFCVQQESSVANKQAQQKTAS